MFRVDPELKVYVHRDAADFRKNITGLAALVEQALELDPFARAVYVFRNKRTMAEAEPLRRKRDVANRQ